MTEESESYYSCPYNEVFCVFKFHADQWYRDPIPLRRAKDYSKASEVDAQLFSAADVGDVELLRQSLEQGANVNFQHCAGTPLTRAARRGHLACVEALFSHGADVNISGNFNCQTCTALHAAASNGHYEVAQLLLDHGADVHAKRDQESTPLHDAAKFGHPDIAELLLRHGAQINVRNSRGKTPLFLAASEGTLDGLRWVLEAVIEYYHYRGYHYNESFFPEHAVEYLLSNEDKVNALNMNDLQDLRTSLLKDDLDTIKFILEDRPAGNIKRQHLQLLKVLLEAGANTELLDVRETGPLEEAIINKDEECVRFLVKHGAVINRAGTMFGWKATPLHHACKRRTEGIVKILLENGADPNARNEVGKTPLHTAAYEGNAEMVQVLLRSGAQVDIVDDSGETPLHCTKTLDCARLLVDHGADVTGVSKCGRSVLFAASDRRGEGACVQFLIDQGADPLKEDENGKSAFDLAVERWWFHDSLHERDDGGVGSVKALMQHGAKLMKTNSTVNNAIKRRKLGLAFALLRSGSDVNAVGKDGLTALFCAARSNCAAAVEMLLEEGADPHIKCHDKSPLHIALLQGYEEVAKLLLQAGAIPDSNMFDFVKAVNTYRNVFKQMCRMQWQDSDGNSLLHIECYRSTPVLVLEDEVDTNVVDKQGISPLHVVCYKGNASLVKLLLKNNADPNKKDINGLTPLHFAAFEGHDNVGILLLENGADVKAQDVKSQTPVHIAAQCGSTNYLEQLLSHGADVNVTDKLGCTPLHQAERNGNAQCVELLVRHGADRSICIPSYNANSEVPLNLLKNISKFPCYACYVPQSDEESDTDLIFGLFD